MRRGIQSENRSDGTRRRRADTRAITTAEATNRSEQRCASAVCTRQVRYFEMGECVVMRPLERRHVGP